MAVEGRLPIMPKMAPRIPMVAGMRTASPTSSSSARDAGEHDASHELPDRGEEERHEPLPQRLLLLRDEVAVHLRPEARPVAYAAGLALPHAVCKPSPLTRRGGIALAMSCKA